MRLTSEQFAAALRKVPTERLQEIAGSVIEIHDGKVRCEAWTVTDGVSSDPSAAYDICFRTVPADLVLLLASPWEVLRDHLGEKWNLHHAEGTPCHWSGQQQCDCGVWGASAALEDIRGHFRFLVNRICRASGSCFPTAEINQRARGGDMDAMIEMVDAVLRERSEYASRLGMGGRFSMWNEDGAGPPLGRKL